MSHQPLLPSAASRLVGIAVALALLDGCAHSHRDRSWLAQEVHQRLGAEMRSGELPFPPDVRLEDGLDEAEVIALVLWRSPAIRADATRIDAAMATLAEANRPANPQISLLAPFGLVSAFASLLAPLESLWQMPSRSRAAARDADAAGESVLMGVLDVVRDVRLLHIELGLAADRAAIRGDLASMATEMARIASVRARLGDISPLEESIAVADAQTMEDLREVSVMEAQLARERLVNGLALDEPDRDGWRAAFLADAQSLTAVDDLITAARAARPDARAATFAIEAAMARAGWERSRAVSLTGIVEGHWQPDNGPAMRLGGRIELPIFGANVGGVGRARAEIERATAQHEVVARRVVLEVRTAWLRAEQAERSRTRFESEILPGLTTALQSAIQTFERGEASYLVVLEAQRRLAEARLRHVELIAEQRRARCELERATGAQIWPVAPSVASQQDGGAP